MNFSIKGWGYMATKLGMATATKLGLTAGTKALEACAMYPGPKGATYADVRAACGGPQKNVLKRVEKMGHKITKTKVVNPKGRMVTAYRIVM